MGRDDHFLSAVRVASSSLGLLDDERLCSCFMNDVASSLVLGPRSGGIQHTPFVQALSIFDHVRVAHHSDSWLHFSLQAPMGFTFANSSSDITLCFKSKESLDSPLVGSDRVRLGEKTQKLLLFWR